MDVSVRGSQFIYIPVGWGLVGSETEVDVGTSVYAIVGISVGISVVVWRGSPRNYRMYVKIVV